MSEKVPDRLYILWDGDSIDGGSIDDWATAPFEGYEHVEYRRADLVDSVSALSEATQEIERLRGEVATLKGTLRMEQDLVALHYESERRLDAELAAERQRADALAADVDALRNANDKGVIDYLDLLNTLEAERQRARLPDDMVERLRGSSGAMFRRWDGAIWAHDDDVNALIRDILAAVEQGEQ